MGRRQAVHAGAGGKAGDAKTTEVTTTRGASVQQQGEETAGVQEVINRFVTLDFLHKERQLSKKDAVALVAFVEHVVESCPENPSSPAFTPSLSPRRADAEKAFRRKAWEFLSQPRHARLLHRECADGLAACYISLSAHIPWKQLSRQILFMALNLLAAAVDEGPIEILELSKYWSEKKSDEKPQSRHQKKEALRVREDYLGATYGWNALERVDPNFTGGTSGAGPWLMPILIFLILSNVVVFLWGNGYIHV